jgi:superfamily II DNA or RNA helicase
MNIQSRREAVQKRIKFKNHRKYHDYLYGDIFARPYQRDIIEDIYDGLKSNDRGRVILPCGAGKTKIALYLAKHLNSKFLLIEVPTLVLLAQWHKELTMMYGAETKILSIGHKNENLDEEDAWEIEDEHLSLQTNPKEIANWISSFKKCLKKNGDGFKTFRQGGIVLCTYRSSPRLAEALQILPKNVQFDLAICDEAHHVAGRFEKNSSNVLFDEQIRCSKRLFFTATPRVIPNNVRGSNAYHGVEASSMDDEKYFGKELAFMSFRDAIEQDILCNARLNFLGCKGFNGNNYRACKTRAVVDFIKKNNCNKIVVFHRLVKHSQAFVDQLKIKGYKIFHIDGKSKNKKKILQDFANAEKAIISNAQCLTEGVDIPAIDCVIFFDPKKSKIDITQAIGRALRGKGISDVVVPLLHSTNKELEEKIDDHNFNAIVNCFSVMAQQDSRLQERINFSTFRGSNVGLELYNTNGNDIEVVFHECNLNLKEKYFTQIQKRLCHLRPKDIDFALEKFNGNKKLACDFLGCCVDVIKDMLAKHEWLREKWGRKDIFSDEEILSTLNHFSSKGLENSEVKQLSADKLGIKISTIRARIRDAIKHGDDRFKQYGRVLTDEAYWIEIFKNHYKTGLKDIAEVTGHGVGYISKIVGKLDSLSKYRRSTRYADHDKVINLHRQGKSRKEIMILTKFSMPQVCKIIKKNLPSRVAKKQVETKKDKMIAYMKRITGTPKEKHQKISKKFGISEKQLRCNYINLHAEFAEIRLGDKSNPLGQNIQLVKKTLTQFNGCRKKSAKKLGCSIKYLARIICSNKELIDFKG